MKQGDCSQKNFNTIMQFRKRKFYYDDAKDTD